MHARRRIDVKYSDCRAAGVRWSTTLVHHRHGTRNHLLVRSGTHPLRTQDRIGTMPDLRGAFQEIVRAAAAAQ